MASPLVRRDPDVFARYTAQGWWEPETIAQRVAVHAAERPEGLAFISELSRMTWREYDARSTELAAILIRAGLEPGERVCVMLPDGPGVHVAFVAAEKAGLVIVGVGPRAGEQELRYLMGRTGATVLVTQELHRGAPATGLVTRLRASGLAIRMHVVVPVDGQEGAGVTIHGDPARGDAESVAAIPARSLGPNDLFLLNSTSGTTGMPKCVMQFQNRWVYFHKLAAAAAAFTPDDVFMSLVGAPFGFGLWTAHFTPTILGAPCVVMSRFTAEGALQLMETERVTVMACVSTQFIMMLNRPEMELVDLGPLRAMFTGGEAVPYARAAQFEERTGASVLQFFGSNETGALSRTSVDDTREQRLATAGKVIPEMQVRLFDDDGADVTSIGGPGQPACKGPATCLGYYDDEAANAQLFTDDGWMLTGDIATIDANGYLRVVGRKSDFIIRGGKNISAGEVEENVGRHPAVAMVAAIARPDDTFGERVCVYVVPRPGRSVELTDIVEDLEARGVSHELFPEYLVVVDEMPQASGGKVAKAALRDDLKARMSSTA
jgi:acyl-CoA synthetase